MEDPGACAGPVGAGRGACRAVEARLGASGAGAAPGPRARASPARRPARLPQPLGVPLRTAQIGHSAARRRTVCVLDFVGLLADLPQNADERAFAIRILMRRLAWSFVVQFELATP